MTIAELAARVRRDTDLLTAAIDAGCPDDREPNPYVGYLTTAALLLETAAARTAVEGLYVEPERLGDIDRLVAELVDVQPVGADA